MTNNKKQTSAGIAEFGKLLGVGHSAVHKAVAVGRIPKNLVGKRVYRGRLVSYIVDIAAATIAFHRNTDPVRRVDGARISAGKRAANAELRGEVVNSVGNRRSKQ